MKRTMLLVCLLAAYAAPSARSSLERLRAAQAFDPFAPASRTVERLVGSKRFAEALPQARRLHDRHAGEPLVAYWLAKIHHGMNEPAAEADAWEEYVRTSAAPAEACPALPDAYEALGRPARALSAYQRCAAYDAHDPARLLDLGRAYERHGRPHEALATYRQAAILDPLDPAVDQALARLSEIAR